MEEGKQEARLPYIYHKLECDRCGRKILVERILVGVDHTVTIVATCADCLEVSEEFKKEYPVGAEDILNWKKAEEI